MTRRAGSIGCTTSLNPASLGQANTTARPGRSTAPISSTWWSSPSDRTQNTCRIPMLLFLLMAREVGLCSEIHRQGINSRRGCRYRLPAPTCACAPKTTAPGALIPPELVQFYPAANTDEGVAVDQVSRQPTFALLHGAGKFAKQRLLFLPRERVNRKGAAGIRLIEQHAA